MHQRCYHKTNQPLRKPYDMVNPTTKGARASGSSVATMARARIDDWPIIALRSSLSRLRPRRCSNCDAILRVYLMDIQPIRTDEDHRAALAEIGARWGAPEGTEEGELKDNRPTQEVEVTDYFPSAPAGEGGQQDLCREGHGRIETRT